MKTTRQFSRSAQQASIEVNGVRGTTFDLSPGGCCAEVRSFVRPGAAVLGRIALGNQAFDYTGEVVWTAHANGIRRLGIRFRGVENAYFDAIQHAGL